jgi:DNA-binding YbaB/EbfC family protein
MVTVTATGLGVLTKVAIDPDAVDTDDIEMLEDMVLAAVNEVHRQAKDLEQQRMSAAMPAGMPGLPF